jgi:hypothetical protein
MTDLIAAVVPLALVSSFPLEVHSRLEVRDPFWLVLLSLVSELTFAGNDSNFLNRFHDVCVEMRVRRQDPNHTLATS